MTAAAARLGLGLSLTAAAGQASAASSFPSGASLYLNFTTGVYGASTAASASPVSRTLAQLVTGAVTPTASGMLIGAADDVSVPLSPAILSGGTWFSNSAGTVYASGLIAYVNGSFPRLFEFTDGSDNSRIIGRYNTTSDIGGVVTVSGSDTELANTPYALNVKFAITWDVTGFATCLNGGVVQTSAVTVPTVTACQLGNRGTTKNRQLDGNLREFRFYPSRKTGPQMIALTT